ncbi:odorant receptor 43a-like [Pseudomyrmex gracilis]|uniref:odorant receptor 43a-like n=1 Tax=Pseudomyrmex gracilis TaxID=219809 RepID=UPI000994984A|nr:odorant receptor 43a-like [Pseudomyrmex gracilis]
MMYSTYLISSFEKTYFILIIFGVLTLSFNIFRIVQIASTTCNIEELLLHFVITAIAFIYMFWANFIGQEVTDHYNDVFLAAYKIPWYIFPLHLQKLIVLLLQRSNKTFGLNVGGLFIASLQCFATLLNASVSYFTVLYSV